MDFMKAGFGAMRRRDYLGLEAHGLNPRAVRSHARNTDLDISPMTLLLKQLTEHRATLCHLHCVGSYR